MVFGPNCNLCLYIYFFSLIFAGYLMNTRNMTLQEQEALQLKRYRETFNYLTRMPDFQVKSNCIGCMIYPLWSKNWKSNGTPMTWLSFPPLFDPKEKYHFFVTSQTALYECYLQIDTAHKIHIVTFFHVWLSQMELKEGPLEQFTHEMEPFLRKQGMPVRLNKGT